MKKLTRKSISVLLSLLMALSVFGGLTFTASAADPIDWTTSDALPSEAGYYRLTTDVALSSTWSPADGTTLDLNGHKITRSGSIDHFISVESGVTFTLDDSKKNSTDPADKHYYSGSAPVSINSGNSDYFIGGYLTGISSSASDGGAIIVQDGGVCNMNGGNIVGNNYYRDGGGVMALAGGTFTLNGGNIIGNSANWGGGVYLKSGSTFNLIDGSIRSNYAPNGGGGVLTWGTFNMSGGTVEKNSSIGPAGFYLFEGEFHLSGGTITANTSSRDQGGLGGAAKTYLSGNPVVSGNTSVGRTSNFNIPNGKTLTLEGPLTEGASIWINTQTAPSEGNPITFVDGWGTYMDGEDPSDYFASDNVNYVFAANGAEITLNAVTYTVSFDPGEGSGFMESVNVQPGYTLPANSFDAPADMLFAGWLSSADGEVYAAGSAVVLREDTTFTAQWAPAVTVSFDSAGGSEVAPQIIPANTAAAVPASPTKPGSVFKCWVFGDGIYDFAEPVITSITLTAVWVEGVRMEESFDSTAAPDGWTAESRWSFRNSAYNGSGTAQPHSEGNMAYHTYSGLSWLIMPAVDLSAQSAASLNFWYQNCYDGSNADNLIVSYRVDGGEWNELFRTTEDHRAWTEAVVSLPAAALTENVEIGFYADVHGGWGLLLDDVVLSAGGHNLSFSAQENILTATCPNDPCTFDGELALTLNAPAKTTYGDENSAAATLTGSVRFNVELDVAASEDDILYYSGETLLDAAPTDAGDYTASLTVNIDGADYTITKNYSIAKADPTYALPTGVTARCGQTLAAIALPEGWAWNDETTPVECVGADAETKESTYAATFTPADTANYNTASAELTVTVSHAYEDHAAQAATCTAIGWDAYQTCNCGYSSYVEIPASGHVGVTHDAKAPTCVDVGWDAYFVCERCGFTSYEEIPATGCHTYVNHAAKAPTCTEIGWKAYQTCQCCDYTTYEELPAKGHRYGTSGYTRYVCQACGAVDEARKAAAEAADRQAAEAVVALIDAIGTVDNSDAAKARIDSARTAYDALTDTQKALVTNKAKLEQAQAAYAAFSDKACKYCGKVHDDSIGGGILAILHTVLYFILHLFGKR